MRRLPLAAASLALVLGATACGSRSAAPAPARAPWAPIEAACSRGEQDCVSLVAAEMTRRYRPLAAACDHNAAFALMYLRVTQAVGRAEPGFADRAYLAQLDASFAKLYFDAFDAWKAGRRSDVPLAWQIAFEAADGGRVTGVGDLLLGMNAHISRDLPFAVAGLGFGSADGAARRRSFEQVNAVLGRVSRRMLREESRRFDPTIARFSLPVLSASPGTLGAVLAGWRNTALGDADRLLGAKTAARRAAVTRSIERTAAARAAIIAAATSRVPFSKAGKTREAFCRAQRTSATAKPS